MLQKTESADPYLHRTGNPVYPVHSKRRTDTGVRDIYARLNKKCGFFHTFFDIKHRIFHTLELIAENMRTDDGLHA